VLALEDEHPTPAQLVQLLELRADIAHRLYDDEAAAALRERAAAVGRTD
jgi:hypothetical protein